jgi:hypothetical protein
MNRLRRSVLLLNVLFAVRMVAQVQSAAQDGSDKLRAELDALITHHQYARAEHIVLQLLASSDDPAAAYFQIGKVYFNHDDWVRSAAFLEKSLELRGANAEAHQLLGLDWRKLQRSEDAEAELHQSGRAKSFEQSECISCRASTAPERKVRSGFALSLQCPRLEGA